MSTRLHGALLNTREFSVLRLSVTAYDGGTAIESHCHDFHHICLVTAGAFEEICESGINALGANSALLHAPRRYHGDVFQERTTCFNVEFDPCWMKGLGVALSSADAEALRSDSTLLFLLREMESAFASNLLFAEGAAIAYALSILQRTAQLCGEGSAWQVDLAARIAAQFQSAIDLEVLSAPFGFHPSYVSRAFHRKTGRTLTGFLHEIRVHKAALMLLDSDASLADIAVAVGYADQAHFTRAFRRLAGAPPGEFRRTRGAFRNGQ